MSLGLPFWEWEFKGHYIHCFIVIYILGSLYPTTQDITLCFELYSVIVKPNEHVFLQFCNRLVIFKFWVNMKIFDTLLKACFLRSHFNFFKNYFYLFIYLSVQSSGQMCMSYACLEVRWQLTRICSLLSPCWPKGSDLDCQAWQQNDFIDWAISLTLECWRRGHLFVPAARLA